MTCEKIGRIENGEYFLPLRVYYEDTDAGGVVFYANYFKFAERARTEMLRHLGIENSTFQDCHGLAFVVRHIDADFIAPARLDDVLEVSLKLTKVGGASLECEQAMRRNGEDLVKMTIRLGCMKLDGGAGRLPADIRTLLQTFETLSEDKDRG